MSAERALGLPALSITVAVSVALHLATVRRRRPLPRAVGVSAYGDDCGRNAQLFSTKDVVVLGVVPLVSQDLDHSLIAHRFAERGLELRRVLARPQTTIDAQGQVSIEVVGHRELWPLPHPETLAASSVDVVTTNVPSLEPRCVDCAAAAVTQELAFSALLHASRKEAVPPPFVQTGETRSKALCSEATA